MKMMDQNKEESDITVGNGHGQYLRNRLSIAPTYHLAFRHCDANKKLYMYICANQFRIWVFVFFLAFIVSRFLLLFLFKSTVVYSGV